MHYGTDFLHRLGGPRADGRPRPRSARHPQVALLVLLLLLGGCSREPLKQRTDRALDRSAAWLVSQQAADGSWKSGVYRDMGGGMELTPFAAKALMFSARDAAAADKGLKFLLAGSRDGLIYPVYTGAGTLLLLSRSPEAARQKEWVGYLSGFQLTEALGWKPEDPDFGGWGYAMKPPRKGGGDPMASANLSSTTFALGALGVSGVKNDKALVFVKRCQNSDGGFRTSLSDLTMNKAGGTNSYGSASSDGLRALLRAGLKPSDPAVAFAWKWVESHFSARRQPGDFPESRFADRDGLLFYYLWSTAHALAARERAGIAPDQRARQMARDMCERVVDLQEKDGSWRNPSSASREDDPLVATPMAMAVLALCRPYLP